MSELIALVREDVDLINGRVSILRALVSGQFKVPKERSRIRAVELISPACDLLRHLMLTASTMRRKKSR